MRRKQQEQRVCESLIADGWTEWSHPEAMPPFRHFKREKRIDFKCVDSDDTWCRIDFVLGVEGGYVFLEVDENQHQYGYDGLLSCDMKRMNKVMSSLALEAGDELPPIYWLRFNPSAWRVDGVLQTAPKKKREEWLCNFVSAIELTEETPLAIGYAYYNSTEGRLEVLENADYHSQFADVAQNLCPYQ
jgi:hypothetical protein